MEAPRRWYFSHLAAAEGGKTGRVFRKTPMCGFRLQRPRPPEACYKERLRAYPAWHSPAAQVVTRRQEGRRTPAPPWAAKG